MDDEARTSKSSADEVERLISRLDAPEWNMRKEAADKLVRMGSRILERLRRCMSSGTENQKYWSLRIAAAVSGENALPWLKKLYSNSDVTTRRHIISAVGEIDSPQATAFLIEALQDNAWLNRVVAADQLESRGRKALKQLQKGFLEGNGDLKYWCLKILVKILGEESLPILEKGLSNEDDNIRYYVIRATEEIEDTWTIQVLLRGLADANWMNRRTAASILKGMGRKATPFLIDALDSGNDDVVYWIVRILAGREEARALRAFEKILDTLPSDSDSPRIRWIFEALSEMGGRRAARVLIEQGARLEKASDLAAEHLEKIGMDAVPILFSYIRSKNRRLQLLARKALLDMGHHSISTLLRELSNIDESEYERAVGILSRLTTQQLEEVLEREYLDLAALERMEEGLTSRSLTIMNTVSLNALQDSGPTEKLVETPSPGSKAESDASELDELLATAERLGASDVHLKCNVPPIFRIEGRLAQAETPPLKAETIERYMTRIGGRAAVDAADSPDELDLAYETPSGLRFRVNVYRELDGPAMALRLIPSHIPTLAELEMPPVIRRICDNREGLVIIAGPTGSGKTTTLAAMIDYINSTREEHIITIEDPIEYRHFNKRSVITYRQVGLHTRSFSSALRSALREDPDVILVGELRDVETVSMAITAAMTGHLVLTTLHTTTAAETVERIVSIFPAEHHATIRADLAQTLRAIICQLLVPTVGGKRALVQEILIRTYAVANLIREAKSSMLNQIITTNRKEGMQTRDDALLRLFKQQLITRETGLQYSYDRNEMEKKLKG